jgi:hypothetical protein
MKAAAEDADSISLLQKVVTFPADVDSEAGLGSLVLTSVDTAITPGTYFYDMQLVDSTNSPPEVTTITSGKVKIMQDISVTDTVAP